MQGDTGGRIIHTDSRTGADFTDTITEETKKRWFYWSRLVALGRKHNYGGTVPVKVIAKRRAKNKVAKASRKANRRG